MKHGSVDYALVLAAGLLLSGDLDAGNLEPPGPPAPTMKTIQQAEPRIPITSLPVTIAAPGSYYLTSDLVGVSGQVGINITSSYVTLDLNGFSLVGVPGSSHGIQVPTFIEHVVIRDGVIRNWGGRGISAAGAPDLHAEDLRVDNNLSDGMWVGTRSIVRGVTSTGNTGNGIAVSPSSTIIGCTAGSNTASGFSVGALSTVSNSTATGNTFDGFTLGQGSSATDCTAQGNTQGFYLGGQGSRVVRSVARANTLGIYGDEGVSVEECTVDANTDDGIRIGGNRGLVRGNFARGNTNDGIHANGSQNRIEDNHSTLNGTGIRVDGSGNLIVKNSAANNTSEYAIVGGNQLGTVSTNPATAGAWANYDQ